MKGRLHAGVTAAAVAQAAKLSEVELKELEETGQSPREIDFPALARLLGLAPAKLAGLGSGWQPAPVSVDRWRELRQITTQGGSFSVNCYLVWDEATRDAALFDTGFAASPLFVLLDENGLQLRHIFITHGHGDHVAALGEIRARYPKARLHSGAPDAPVDQRNRPNEFLHLGSLRITNRATPGHADDGFTYVIGNWPEDAPHVAIIGDTLFAGSMGKVSGDAAAAREVIRTQILTLPPSTLLCPGHGPMTTVAEERDHNPFV